MHVKAWATQVIGPKHAEVLQKQEIGGQTLLTLKTHELVEDGMLRGLAHKLIEAVRKLVAPEPKTILIDMSEGEEDPISYTIKSQS
ncbi:hypothetical protein B484DRAFT_394267 [Ochromonadaceae sp. CCMP2298]|nr:hypothetical protein B484DRAFT_394267 [Ochromonadaceae sp. CCMP2298]